MHNLLWLRQQRDTEREYAAGTHLAANLDSSTMQLHNLFDNIQAHTQAADMLRIDIGGTVEALEQLRQRLGGMPMPVSVTATDARVASHATCT